MKLTEKQRECLRAIGRVEQAQDLAPTAAEVSRLAGRVPYWALQKLEALEGHGYVTSRISHIGMRKRWHLSASGRALLAEEKRDA